MRIQHAKRVLLCLVVFLLTSTVHVSAESMDAAPRNEVVIVMDTSDSMRENDPEHLAADSIKQFARSIPSYWAIGFVTYSEQVIDVVELTDAEGIIGALDHITYSGYTNTGEGIRRAMEMFTPNAREKAILLLTDGEISLPDEERTNAAVALMDEVIEFAASNDIKIHTIGLGDGFQSYENSVKRCSEATHGVLHEAPLARDLTGIANRFIFDVFGTNNTTVGVAQMSAGGGRYSVKIPMLGIRTAKVQIISESAVENVAVSSGGSQVRVLPGRKHAVVLVENPVVRDIVIEFTSSGISHAEMMLEANVNLETEVTYTDTPLTERQEIDGEEYDVQKFERTAQLRLGLFNDAGDNLLLDVSESFRVLLGDEFRDVQVVDGYLNLELSVAEAKTIPVSVFLDRLGLNTLEGVVTSDLSLEKPPEDIWTEAEIEPEPEPVISPVVLLLTITGLFLVIGLLFFFFRKKDNEQEYKQKDTLLPESSKFEFTGKLNLYVTKAPDGEDIAPQTFDLFRLNRKRRISVKTILDRCNIKIEFPGTEKLEFVAEKNGLVQIANQSDCTVLVGSSILSKNHNHQMEYGDKIHITCSDESEMELHYKSVKPSEKTTVVNPAVSYSE